MIDILPYTPAYEAGVLALFALPVSGQIVLSLARGPRYLDGAEVQTERPEVYVAVERHRATVAGVFNIGTRRVMLHGAPVQAPYFCDLRIHPDYQNSSLLLRMIRFLGEQPLDLAARPALTVVFGDNHKMLDMIARRLRKPPGGVPFYREVATLATHVFRRVPRRWAAGPELHIRRASVADVPAMMALQAQENQAPYRPYYDWTELAERPYYRGLDISDFFLAFAGEALRGMAGVYDTRGFKQTVVQGYDRVLAWSRPVLNLLGGRLLGYPHLPAPGEALPSLALHSVLIAQREPAIFQALLREMARQLLHEPSRNLLCTLDTRDPLQAVLQRLPAAIRKSGRLYLVTPHLDRLPFSLPPYWQVDAPRI